MSERHTDNWSHPGHYLVDSNGHQMVTVMVTYYHPLCAMSIGPPTLIYSYFKIWPWKSMVKVMCVVKGQGHIWPSTFKGQDHSQGQTHCPQLRPGVQSICLFFVSWQSDHFELPPSSSMNGSVRPSVCLSVTPFWLCSCHCIIMKFSEFINIDRSDVHAKGQGQRSKVKVTEVMTPLSRFRTVTQVWIHIWWWNDAYSLMLLRRGALLFSKVMHQIARSHSSKNRRFWPKFAVSGL